MIGDQVVYEPGLATQTEFAQKKKIGADECPVNVYGNAVVIGRWNFTYKNELESKTKIND